ncbi:unnamed protein product [Cyprideis torosa]|uniref:Uncharacterized protein n=1 Tax=Cyprideis torosa TaxID=163714 RepID=A0A7R8WV07_9CRUS|nr:unnamed protein product [Cyprideis torosa]CAG0906911.1 unnamed protein product [Cyprideis torosa]
MPRILIKAGVQQPTKTRLFLPVNWSSFNATCCKFLLSAGDRRLTVDLRDGNFHRSLEQTLEALEPPPNIIPCNCRHHVSPCFQANRFPRRNPLGSCSTRSPDEHTGDHLPKRRL